MARFHEEFVCQAAEILGQVAKAVTDLGDGPTLRSELARSSEFYRLWSEWSEAASVKERVAIEEQMEMEGLFLR